MTRKRSLKTRYLRFLRRIWPAPTLAATVLSVGVAACASQPVPSGGAQGHTVAAAVMAHPSSDTGAELRYEHEPQLLLPMELHLAPDFRSACAPIIGLPPSLVLDEKDAVVDALEPIASCLTLGPMSHRQLHPVGSSELPGRWDAPVDGNGRADQLRSSLSLLGVPSKDLVTHPVDNGNGVELGGRSRLDLKEARTSRSRPPFELNDDARTGRYAAAQRPVIGLTFDARAFSSAIAASDERQWRGQCLRWRPRCIFMSVRDT